jgi:hypothetical protein
MAIRVFNPNGFHVEVASLATAAALSWGGDKTVIVDSAVSLSGNLAWPADRLLDIRPGGIITTTGHTLTFTVQPRIGNYQAFAGTGAVAGLTEAYPEWFGAAADGTTDDSDAIEAAIASLTAGGILRYQAKSYAQNVVVAQCNISIRGAGRSSTAAKGGVGGTILKSYSTASPCLQIGDGTNYVRAISFRGFSVQSAAAGAISGNDGIKINGAESVHGTDFDVIGFGGDNISIVSTASRASTGIKLSMFDSSYAWGANYRAVYGSTYVTDLGIIDYHMTGRNYTGAYSVYLSGGIKLFSHAGWIDTGGDRQGHVYLDSINDSISGGLIIDGSYGGSATDTTVECNAAARSYPSNVLIGNVTFNKSMLWGDATKTSGGTTGGLPYNVVTQQIRAGNVILSASPASLADAATDSKIYASGNDVWMMNNSTSNGCFIRMGAAGYLQIGGTGVKAGSVILAEIAVANAPSGSFFVDSADHKLKFKDSGGTVNLLY